MTHTTVTTRRTARAAGALGGAALVAIAAVAPTSAATGPDQYVALGDSYSAGVGTRAPVDSCYRSPFGYPALIAQQRGLSFSYQACSGAQTSDVLAGQLSTLSSRTSYVTITIGGNDLGFTSVLAECAKPSWWGSCNAKIDAARRVLAGQLPARLDAVYGAIHDRATDATVAVVGYPRLFNGQDCNALTFFSPAEEARLNQSADMLSSTSAARAKAHGDQFVDVRSAFTGHAVCDNPEWVNGLSWPVGESYHPNRAGNVAYANLVSPVLTGSSAQIIAALPQQLSTYQGRSTLPEFVVPDITSHESLAAARAAGLNPRDIIAAAHQLRSGNRTQMNKGKAKLVHLERQASANLAAKKHVSRR